MRAWTSITLAAMASAVAGGAAAQTLDATSTSMGADASRVFTIGPQHVVVMALTDYERVEAMDASSPMNGLNGPCFGMIDSNAGVVSGGGWCTLEDEAGDSATLRWTATSLTETSNSGDWELAGGTGTWDGATGGGQFQFVSDPATQRFSTTLTGEVTLR